MVLATRMLRGLARQALDFALPPRCPGCGVIVGDPYGFCVDCWSRLTFLGPPCCASCGLPFAFAEIAGSDADAIRCGACIADPPPFDRMRAAVAYGDVSRAVALKLKYAGRPGVAETMARFMMRHVEFGARESGGPPLLVPVPLHRWRIWKRGYNQAALIASALGRMRDIHVAPDALERVKATPVLRGLSRGQRARAVRGAFRVTPTRRTELKGRTVLLVDDVFTSGATARGCAAALKRAGAARVEIICWARVVAQE